MKRRLEVKRTVADEVDAILDWLFARSPAAAERFPGAVLETATALLDRPFIGHRIGGRKHADVRVLRVRGFHSYLVYYRVDDKVVRVLSVAHGARDRLRLRLTEP